VTYHAFLLSGVILKRSNRVLTIQRVKKEDSGLYICTACNQQGCDYDEAHITVDGEWMVYFFLLKKNKINSLKINIYY